MSDQERGADAPEPVRPAEAPGPIEPEPGESGLPEPVPERLEGEDGPLLDFEVGETLEAHDRKHSGPGGEPECPLCSLPMVRSVEQHRAPRSDDSPFRIRLVCSSAKCGAWTSYNW